MQPGSLASPSRYFIFVSLAHSVFFPPSCFNFFFSRMSGAVLLEAN